MIKGTQHRCIYTVIVQERHFDVDATKWYNEGLTACYPAIKQKYIQNPSAKNHLLSTGSKIIVESTTDSPWGMGLVLNNSNALNESELDI